MRRILSSFQGMFFKFSLAPARRITLLNAPHQLVVSRVVRDRACIRAQVIESNRPNHVTMVIVGSGAVATVAHEPKVHLTKQLPLSCCKTDAGLHHL